MEVRGELTREAQEAAEDAASDLKADDELSTVESATDANLMNLASCGARGDRRVQKTQWRKN